MPVTGGCQCGFVRYELTGKPLPIVTAAVIRAVRGRVM